jgi:hypothetical protein
MQDRDDRGTAELALHGHKASAFQPFQRPVLSVAVEAEAVARDVAQCDAAGSGQAGDVPNGDTDMQGFARKFRCALKPWQWDWAFEEVLAFRRSSRSLPGRSKPSRSDANPIKINRHHDAILL